jgi:hypothetical protein
MIAGFERRALSAQSALGEASEGATEAPSEGFKAPSELT